MSEDEALPILLVSAADENAAAQIMAELIDNDVTDEVAGASEGGDEREPGRVWRLVNKYYSADVRVWPRPAPAAAPEPPPERVEAHLVHLAEDELSESVLVSRVEPHRWAACCVRVALLGAGAAPPAALAAAARRLRLELVPPREADREADGEAGGEAGGYPELQGVARAREALHAHAWRGLRRRHRAPPRVSGSSDSDSESSDLHSEDVERAERFAELLGALPSARDAVRGEGQAGGGGGGGGARGERLQRAELMLDAFCRALGADLRDL